MNLDHFFFEKTRFTKDHKKGILYERILSIKDRLFRVWILIVLQVFYYGQKLLLELQILYR
jgi:hypothetical protein